VIIETEHYWENKIRVHYTNSFSFMVGPLYKDKTSERTGTKWYNLYALQLSKDTVVTGQGKRTPLMVYADHTDSSIRKDRSTSKIIFNKRFWITCKLK
jgi:hypothetical protein